MAKITLSTVTEIRATQGMPAASAWNPEDMMIFLSEVRREVERTANKMRRITDEPIGTTINFNWDAKHASIVLFAKEGNPHG